MNHHRRRDRVLTETMGHVLTPTGAIKARATVLMLILGFGLALGLTIGYVAHKGRQDDRRWCELLSTLVTPQPSTPPQTPQEVRGRKVTEEIRKLHGELHCGQR